jgi:glycosyltransferase involved in cell wall biosynthesis
MMPPLVYPRSIQVSRTLKGLRARGWTTDVITVKANDASAIIDEALAAIYSREYSLNALDLQSWRRLRTLFGRTARRAHPLNSPDENAWLAKATEQTQRFTKRGIDALVTFGQPWIDHVVGLECTSRIPGLPWIAHFSDPWVDSPYVADYPSARLNQWRIEERAVIERADAIVFVNRHTADLVMSKYREISADKIFVVPHAYDPDILSHVTVPPSRPDRLHVVHTGNLYPPRRPHAFLRGVHKLVTSQAGEIAIEMTFVGAFLQKDVELAAELGLHDHVKFIEPKPFLESFQIAATADLLLVIDAPSENNVFLPSKIVDYFALGKPILGITPEQGATADALRRSGHRVARSDDVEAIYITLAAMIDDWKKGQLGSRIKSSEVERYHVRSTSIEFERAIQAAIYQGAKR